MENETEASSNVSKNGIESPKIIGNAGYIYIPSQIDRNTFIQQCLRTYTVSIVTEDGQIMNNVPISKSAINSISFPSDTRKLGSPVVYMIVGKHDKPVVLGVFNALDEYANIEEDQFFIERRTQTGSVSVSGKGKTGELFINLECTKKQQDNSGGKFYIHASNADSSAELNISVEGSVNLETTGITKIKSAKEIQFQLLNELSDKIVTNLNISNGVLEFDISNLNDDGSIETDNKTTIKYTKSEGFSLTDEFGNVFTTKDGEVNFDTKKFSIKSGGEKMILGDTLKKLLSEFIDAVAAITTTTMLGPQPIINIQQVQELKQKLDSILSKYGYLD